MHISYIHAYSKVCANVHNKGLRRWLCSIAASSHEGEHFRRRTIERKFLPNVTDWIAREVMFACGVQRIDCVR